MRAADTRSIRAIKQGTEAWNLVAKYLAEEGERVGVKSPRVSQQAGVGGGLPEHVLSPQVRGKLNAAGSGGPQGQAGPQGPAGPTGPPGLADLERVEETFEIAANTAQQRAAGCPPGKVIVGGGVSATAYFPGMPERNLIVTGTCAGSTTWSALISNPYTQRQAHIVQAICANAAS